MTLPLRILSTIQRGVLILWNIFRREPVGIVSLVIGIVTIYFSSMSYSQQGVNHAWTTIRSHAPGNYGLKAALEFLDSRQQDLRGINLIPSANAEEGELHRANVERANLDGVDLSDSWLDKTDLSESSFVGSDLSRTRLRNSVLEHTNFQEAILRDAILDESQLLETTLIGATLDGASLRKSELIGALAEGLIGVQVDLNGATIFSSGFRNANLSESVFLDTRVVTSSLVSVNLENSQLVGAYFINSDLTDARLTSANVTAANFVGTNISGIDFSVANGVESAEWRNVWAWDDNAPTLPDHVQVRVQLYRNDCRSSDGGPYFFPPLDRSCYVDE